MPLPKNSNRFIITTKCGEFTTKCCFMNPFVSIFPNSSFVKVLMVFLAHPNEEFYQSSVVDSTGCALTQVQRALIRLEKAGLISKTKSGNRSYYVGNQKHPAFEDIKRALFKTVLFGDSFKKALEPLKNKIKYGFIYGSVASANESSSSDVDLFIIGELGLRDIANVLGNVGKEIGREINPNVYTIKEFKKKLKEGNPFLNEILHQPKIWLIGEEGEFTKMGL